MSYQRRFYGDRTIVIGDVHHQEEALTLESILATLRPENMETIYIGDKMDARDEMSEVHGEEFADNFDNEFDLDPEDAEEVYVPSVKERVVSVLNRLQQNKLAWYVAGFFDGIIVLAVLQWLLK